MKGWAKVLPTESHDLLVQRLSNHDDGECVKLTVCTDGVDVTVTLSMAEDGEAADFLFTSVNEVTAEKHVNFLLDQVQ